MLEKHGIVDTMQYKTKSAPIRKVCLLKGRRNAMFRNGVRRISDMYAEANQTGLPKKGKRPCIMFCAPPAMPRHASRIVIGMQ